MLDSSCTWGGRLEGVAHRRPANTPPALPRIQTASAHTHGHRLAWCNGGCFFYTRRERRAPTRARANVFPMCRRNKAVGIGRTGNKDSGGLFYGCQRVRPHARIAAHISVHKHTTKQWCVVTQAGPGGVFTFCGSLDLVVSVCVCVCVCVYI